MVQLPHPYMTAGKTIALTMDLRWQRLSLLFNMLSRFVIAFLPRSKCFLISWLQSSSTVILELKKRKSVTSSTFSPSISHEMMGLDAMILVFLMLTPLFHLYQEAKWQPTPVFLTGEFHRQRSLVGYNPWSRKESGTTE